MKKIYNIIINIFLIFVILVCILPFLYMILMSTKSTINAYDISFNLADMSLAHYQRIFSDPTFIRYFLNSVFIAIAGVLLTLFTSCTAGYAFAKLKFKGRDKIFFLLLLTLLIPSQAILVPLYLLVRGFGWVNTFRALILPLPTAFGVFIMRNAIMEIPIELVESAQIDGASKWKILRVVILPLVESAMLTIATFTFVGAWNNFTWPLIITTDDLHRTLPIALTTMKTQYDTDVGLSMASATVTFLPPFIFYLLLQSKFRESMALSGLKE